MKTSHTKWMKWFLLLAGILSFSEVWAQTGEINLRGTVNDEMGEPIIGANVMIKDTSQGTITDLDGNFILNTAVNQTLVISFIGYESREIVVQNSSPLSIVLKENTELLSELVVIGYGSIKKEDLTGSIVAIKAEELNKGAVTSPQELMQGKVPGLFVRPGNGQPGAGSTIRIRSGASLNASNDPLIVIDGVPVGNDAAPGMSNPLSSINPNDIETFTVLKDASATAIYGSRASNGVILITTKKGTSSFKVAYNSTYSISDPNKKLETMKAGEFRETVLSAFADKPTYGDVKALLDMYPEQSTPWQDEIFRTAFATDQTVSVSGTTLSTPYRVSVGYNNTDGTLKTSNYERYTADVSLTPKFFDNHLSVTLNVKGIINNNQFANTGAVGSAAFYDPTKPIYNETGDFNGYWNWTTSGGDPNTQSGANPIQSLLDRFDNGKTKRSIGNLQLDYKLHFLPELRMNLNLGYDVAKGSGDKGPNIGSFDAQRDGIFPGTGTRSYWENFRRNQVLEYYLNYEKEIKPLKSNLNVMGGYSWQTFYYADYSKSYSVFEPGTQMPEVTDWIKDEQAGTYTRTGARRVPGENYIISFFGRLNYTLMERYLLTVTLRHDGSSKFASGNQWGTFPSFALAWNVNQESFMQQQDIFSTLKLRLGYGKTGQQDLSDYQYIGNYLTGTNTESLYLGEYLMKPGKYNPDLKWETTETYNVGIDYGFLNNRINGSVEYYQKNTKDLLSVVNVPAGTNFSNLLFTNIGNMENKGVEFIINTVPVNTRDFTWDLSFNATWNKSRITKLVQQQNEGYIGTEAGTGMQRHMVGYAPYTYYVYQQVYDENGKPIQNALVDRDGDGEITSADRYFAHSPMPDWFLGASSQFTYKQFDLGFNLRASIGNYSYNELAANNASVSQAYSGMGFLTNLYGKPIRDTGFTETSSTEQKLSDHFLEDASFLKMDNITLGYSFSKLFGAPISGRLSFALQNVFTLTKYKGIDPENAGVDSDLWPRPRVYTFGLNLNF